MRRNWGILLVLLSMFGLAQGASAQQDPTRLPGRQASEFSLEQNYPNPFRAGTPTRIPMILNQALFAQGAPVVVSLHVYNILHQLVAVPTAIGHAGGEGQPVRDLQYTQPGRHEALWDGRDQSGNPMVAGVYLVTLVVNGEQLSRRIFVQR